jgi:hypothetical protein
MMMIFWIFAPCRLVDLTYESTRRKNSEEHRLPHYRKNLKPHNFFQLFVSQFHTCYVLTSWCWVWRMRWQVSPWKHCNPLVTQPSVLASISVNTENNSRSTVFIQKLLITQLVKKFPAFMETESLSPHAQEPATEPCPETVHAFIKCLSKLYILILSFHLHLHLWSDMLPSDFTNKIVYSFPHACYSSSLFIAISLILDALK